MASGAAVRPCLLQAYLVSGGLFSRFPSDELFSWVWIRPEAFILCDGKDDKILHLVIKYQGLRTYTQDL